jgi:hypothetical protein
VRSQELYISIVAQDGGFRSWTVNDDRIAICTRCGSFSRDDLEALHQLIGMYLQYWPQEVQKTGLQPELLIPGI